MTIHRTTQQLEVIRLALGELPCPVTASAIVSRTGLVPSTVYRTLDRMVCSGEVSVAASGKEIAYELVARHHHHVHCVRCAHTAHVDCDGVGEVHSTVAQTSGFSSIQSHVVEFFGICDSCAINES